MRPAHINLTVSEIYPKVCWYGVNHRKRVCSGLVDLQILAIAICSNGVYIYVGAVSITRAAGHPIQHHRREI